MKAAAGDPIECACGYQVGAFINSIEDGAPVTRNDIAMFSFSPNIEANRLRCKSCETVIAETVKLDLWRVHGRDGWIS